MEHNVLSRPLQTQTAEWILTIIKLLPTIINGKSDGFRREESILPFPNSQIISQQGDLSGYPPEARHDLSEAIYLRDRWGTFETAAPYFSEPHWRAFQIIGYVPPAADRIEPLLKEFIAYMQRVMSDTRFHPYQIAALIHYGISLIHPFERANGCVARLLVNIYLMQQGIMPVCFPDGNQYYSISALRNEAFEVQFGDLIATALAHTSEVLQKSVFPKGLPVFRP